MLKLLLLLTVLSSMLGGVFPQQNDTDMSHFESCDQRLSFNYPSAFIIEEDALNWSVSTPEKTYDQVKSQIYLQHTSVGDEFDRLHQNAQIRLTVENLEPFLDGFTIDVEQSIHSLAEGTGYPQSQELELYGYSSMIAYNQARDGLLLQLIVGEHHVLRLWANAGPGVPLSILEETVDLLVQSLEFEPDYADGDNLYFFFTKNCMLSLFYPEQWSATEYRGRYLIHDSPDARYNYSTGRRIAEGNVLIEIWPQTRILSYFELDEDDVTSEAVIESYLSFNQLIPLAAPVLMVDDPERTILRADLPGGIVSVVEFEDELILVALQTGSDIEEYADEYWAVIDSVRVGGRAEAETES
jgi:hypothetical protein